MPTLRPKRPTDESFIYSSWLKSFRDSPVVAGVPNTIYYKRFHDLIENLLAQPSTQVWIACADDDPDQIFGYVVASQTVLPVCHWVYVKHPFRGFGIGRQLVAQIKPTVHTTRPSRPTSLTEGSVLDPFYLFNFIKGI